MAEVKTDKRLRQLSRAELLELLMEQNKENGELRDRLETYGWTEEETDAPSDTELKEELDRTSYRDRFKKTLGSTVGILVVVAALAVLVATFLVPAFQIYGNSMTPTLYEGQVVLSVKNSAFRRGELIAFYYNNKILVKRVIAMPGEWVDIDESGNVYVDGNLVDEPYVSDRALGDCNITLPYQVPENRVFVMGDHRSVSVDSRNTSIGCVAEEQVVGRLVFRIWPLAEMGGV